MLKVVRLEEGTMVARALMMVKVAADANNRPQVVDAANIFRARVVDVAPDSVVIEAIGTQGKLRALLEVLEPFGIRELISSGQIALNRGPKTMAPSVRESVVVRRLSWSSQPHHMPTYPTKGDWPRGFISFCDITLGSQFFNERYIVTHGY